MSFNEAILKLLNPLGNRQNLHGTKSYPIPWQISEGKYGIKHYSTRPNLPKNGGTINVVVTDRNMNKIDYVNNLYEYSYGGQKTCGFLAQNIGLDRYSTKSNGFGLCYQDNYEDKPEIRVETYYEVYYQNPWDGGWPGINNTQYNKNGHAEPVTGGYMSGNYFSTVNIPVITTYKTSETNYMGMWPVFAI